ncbi:hypothetical protein niasHS_003048 [Heterodera schachtii]|uniref:C2H2-type domain-containing protein n=1 Tax=Heterodera schachtii TaxID=97005 RepID=A0ABD2KA71_HETSC
MPTPEYVTVPAPTPVAITASESVAVVTAPISVAVTVSESAVVMTAPISVAVSSLEHVPDLASVRENAHQPGPFPCTFCEKKYTSKQSLINHQTVHTGERNFHCHQCAKKFAHSENLRRHCKSVHRGFKCHECETDFERVAGEASSPSGLISI